MSAATRPTSPSQTPVTYVANSAEGAGKNLVQSNMAQRRCFWRMRCTGNGVLLQTTEIDSKNQLALPTATDDELYNTADSFNGPFDYSEEKLTQEIEKSSQEPSEKTSIIVNREIRYKSPALQRVLGNNGIDLSGEQKAVLHLVLNTKQNVFFTGAAGTGKSVLLRCMIALLKEKYGSQRVYVAAYTGIAACNIGGTTLHRWAGIGIGNQPVDKLIKRVLSNKKTKERWLKTRVLLIDEVSMLSVSLLKKLEEIARHVRNSPAPFGGIQIICTGDLFQLPPIDQNDARFCFETQVWDQIIHRTVNLTQVFRQKDPRFANILNEMRMGHVSKEANELMCSLSRPPKLPKGLVPTRLFPTRNEVSSANRGALDRIKGTMYEYECEDWKKPVPEAEYIDMEKHTIAEKRITLKVGAQVMLIKNLDDTLVNGSIGRVVGFMTNGMSMADAGGYDSDSHYSTRSKSVSSRFADTYPTTTEELLGLPSSGKKSKAESEPVQRKRILAERISNEAAQKTSVVPVVRFVTPNNTVRFLMVQPETWEVTNVEGETIASRTQVPLILAWALSVHKSQGQTLPYVSVNLGRIFEYGQAYVAISRATSLEGLQVINFSPHKITASRVVTQFYQRLAKISPDEIEKAEKFFREMFVADIEMEESDTQEKLIDSSDNPLEPNSIDDSQSEGDDDIKVNLSDSLADRPNPTDENEVTEHDWVVEAQRENPNHMSIARATFSQNSSPLPLSELGDSNDNMFSEFNSDEIDFVTNAVCGPNDKENTLPSKRAKKTMIFSSSQSQYSA